MLLVPLVAVAGAIFGYIFWDKPLLGFTLKGWIIFVLFKAVLLTGMVATIRGWWPSWKEVKVKFVDGIRWLRNNPTPSFMSSVMGSVMLLSGTIGYVLGNGQGNEWVYQLITIIGIAILLVINWGAPLRREE